MNAATFDETLTQAIDHLAQNDPVLAPVIARSPRCTLKPHTNYYEALVDAIISQQLSVKAAATIEKRFCALFGSDSFPPAEAIVTKSAPELRTAGLSTAKATYVRDLAEHVINGQLAFERFPLLDNDGIIRELIAVKGIGEWSAHMFLIFCMGRLDVLPVGDLGIKNGIKRLYGLDNGPTSADMLEIAQTHAWHPYESVAAWYVWRSLDNQPAVV